MKRLMATMACMAACGPAATPVGKPAPVPSAAASTSAVAAPAPAPAPSPPMVVVDPAPILAKHRQAVGGDAAIARAARMRMRWKETAAGLESIESFVVDGGKMRSETKTPILAADAIEVWDGKRLVRRGWNGDVRMQGPTDRAHVVTSISVLTLGYLREPSTRIEGLPPVEEHGTSFERLRITPEGGAPIEMWIRPDGLAAKTIIQKAGRTKTRTLDGYAKFGDLTLPKTVKHADSMTKEPDVDILESVELVATPVDPKTFEPPAAKPDVTFPKGVVKVRMPAGFLLKNYLSVVGTLGGRTSTFLLDTGASMTVFDEDFLKEAGVKIAGGATYASAAVFEGVRFARVPELDVAGIKVASQVAYVIPLRKSPGFPLPVDGILGYDFWSRFVTTVDYPVGTVTFHKPGTFTAEAADTAIPFELENTSVHVPVTVNGKNAGTFELDTGNGGEVTIHRFEGSTALVPRGGNPLRFAHGLSYGSSAAAEYEISADIGLGPFVWKAAPVMLLDPADPAGAATSGNGNLGVEMLRSFVVTFDYAKTTIYLRQVRPHRPASTVGVHGMAVKRQPSGAFVVDEVAAGWPADAAGIKPGDVIVAIEGIAPTAAGSDELVPGEHRKYTLRRGPATVEATVVAAAHP